jgi:glycosyltransferase involved in cell wall biosynthesis
MHGGGAERAALNVSRGIADLGHAVDLVLAQAEGPHLNEIPSTVRLINLEARRVLWSLPALVRYLRNERPSALLAVMNHANIIALWAKRLAGVSTRIVVSERNTLSLSADHALTWRARLMPRLIQWFYPWADGITAVSNGVADDLARTTGINRQLIQVIYNPIVTPELHQKTQTPLDHPWFAPGQPPVLLGVGRLREQKDFPTLIQAFALARAHYPTIRLMILGEGPERPALEALINQLRLEHAISLPGFVANPYPYMARAAAFVLSSKWEGLPGVLIEALYCGTRLIATDCPSGAREVLGDGKYGQLVPVGDVATMAQAIEQALSQRAPHPSPAGWKPFSFETTIHQHLQLLMGPELCAP